jgi:amidase
MNGIVGLKPTVGLISGRGIIPVAPSQDTAGPMARSVAGVAVLLVVMASHSPHAANYVAALDANALAGKRIGVLRPETRDPELDIVYHDALERLRAAGAVLIDVRGPDLGPIRAAESTVMLTELKAGLDRYLAQANPAVTVRSLGELIQFDRASLYEMELFGQDLFLAAENTSGLDDPGYRAALEQARRLAGAQGIDRLLSEYRLDLLVAPTAGPAWRVDVVYGDRQVETSSTLPAVAGYPDLSVPMGEVEGLPVGLSFIGPAWSESLLLACGYAFSLRSPPLPPPDFLPSIEGREFAPGNPY